MTPIAGVDIETTGFDPADGHRIVEIAALIYDLETEKLLKRWVQRVNPQRPIPTKAQEVHGISFDMVANEPAWELVAPKVSRIITTVPLFVAHNAKFDLPFIVAELQRVGQPIGNPQVVDTAAARWATPFGKTPSLGELCFACGVHYDPAKAHRADYDVEVMMASFFAGLRKGFFKLPEVEAAA